MGVIKISFEEVSKTFLEDKATGGKCFNAYISIEQYILLVKDVYERSNLFQRRLFDIKRKLVYNKLVRDLVKGVVIPTISIYIEDIDEIIQNMEVDQEKIRILDGLQRTNCILYAYELLKNPEYDRLTYDKIEDPMPIKNFLSKPIRVEIWTNLTVNGILYKMISLNAGQTRMDEEHQFEVLELPLLKELEKQNINVFRKSEDRKRKGAHGFLLSNIVEGVIAYNYESPFPNKQATAISLLDRLDVYKKRHDSTIVKSEVVMNDLLWVLKDLHENIEIAYDTFPEFKWILAEKDTFFIPLMAAIGKARNEIEDIEDAKAHLIEILKLDLDDPFNLKTFENISSSYTSGIGHKRRKLVYLAFLSYFRGLAIDIDWNMADDFL